MNVLLTGLRGAGKSTVCQTLAALVSARRRDVAGIVTPALDAASGHKVGIEAEDLRTGQRWLLAHMERDLDGPRIGPYTFDAGGLARALRVLEDAIVALPDLLVVDEIGPLELEHGYGFAPIIERLPLHGPGHLLLVVRPSLLGCLRQRLDSRDFDIYTVTERNRSMLPAVILTDLFLRD